MQISDQILLLITNQLEGIATTEEQRELQQWITASSENEQAYKEMVTIWETSPGLLQKPGFDSEAAWQKLDAIIQNKQELSSTTTPIRSIAPRKWLAIAAAILIAVTAGWFAWNSYQARPVEVMASANNETVQLPDGSSVLLRKGSILRYPNAFKSSERNVQLVGEAFFQVQHDEHKPFNISTTHSKVTVLGTSFMVDADNEADKVVVVTGKVKVAANSRESREVVLTAGQEVLVAGNQLQQGEVTDSNFMAWKTGVLDFKDAELSKVLKDVEHYYDTPIGMTDQGQNTVEHPIRLNVQFQNQSLDQVIDEIKLLTGLSVKKEGDSLIFYKK
ncbi:MAG: FecR domain-containing protein [Chitinophagaceae bacterium]